MNIKNIILLLILSSLWGASFLFMKILVPTFGPFYTAGFRVLIGGLFLLIIFLIKKDTITIKKDFKTIALVGFFQSAFPFTMFSLAAYYIPSVLSVIINSLTPVFVAIFAFLILKEKLSLTKAFGLLLGIIGVILVSITTSSGDASNIFLGSFLCILGAASYGIAALIIKVKGKHINVASIAIGSQLLSALLLLPIGALTTKIQAVSLNEIQLLLLFGMFCSGVAFYIYFYLQSKIGPLKTSLVTIIQPIFGIIWGVLILHELVGINFIFGGIIALVGVSLVLLPERKNIEN